MKLLTIYSLIAFISLESFGLTTQEAFKKFYDSPEISYIHCGVNIQLFLQYLDKNNVEYNKGKVVSIHDDYAYLNHFNARWGDKEFYENDKTYFRSNWYFHVFLILDGYAYDFSAKYKKVLPVQKYLKKSYLPKYPTEKIFIQGVLTKDTELEKYKNMEMNFYDPKLYKIDTEGKSYSGKFFELFN